MNTAEHALAHWGFEGANVDLVAARENAVYRVDWKGQSFALRLHRQGYRTKQELLSELDWMAHLSANGVSVPEPRPSANGAKLVIVDGTQVDVLSWLSGGTLDEFWSDMDAPTRRKTLHQLGVQMARLHEISDAWPGAAQCTRPHWNKDGFVGSAPLWDRFWENPKLTPVQKELLIAFRDRADQDLEALAPNLDYGLIHADLCSQNIMVDNDVLYMIDFDDGGFGFRLFEIVTALVRHRADPDYEALKSNLIAGYHSVRPLDMAAFDLIMALRAATYVGWNITRSAEDPKGERNARHIKAAIDCAAAYLAG